MMLAQDQLMLLCDTANSNMKVRYVRVSKWDRATIRVSVELELVPGGTAKRMPATPRVS